MQAITTKSFGPTDFKGARMKATAEAGSITIPYDHALSADGNHKAACEALIAKMEWYSATGEQWYQGTTHRGERVWVCVPKHAEQMVALWTP